MKKAQTSMEFLFIFGIGFAITLIIGAIFFSMFDEEKQTLDKKHIENIGNEIMSNVDKLYFLSRGNKFTIDANFPEGITNLTIRHYENISVGTEYTAFDQLVIETYDQENLSHFFETSENYIRFNCTKCYNTTETIEGIQVNISYYNESNFNDGLKKIKFESMGDWVNINFVQ